MKKRRWLGACALALALFLLASYGAGWLLMPPRESYGSTWESYLQEEGDTIDVLFFGSSLAYCDIAPGVIWAEGGTTSYLMAGPEQTIPLTYYYVREACKTQSPKVVAVEVTGMFYPRYCNFSKTNVTYMPWSLQRLGATFCGAEPELWAGLLFPLLDYHSRWREVTAGEVAAHLQPERDPMAGYTFLEAAVPQGEETWRPFTAEGEDYARNLEYLGRIASFCREEGIQLLLFLSPSKGRVPPEALEQLRADAEALPGAVFVDFNESWAGREAIDDGADWFDALHFNCRGAEKFSRYLAEYLAEELGLPPTEGEDEGLWRERAETFAARLRALEG